VLRKLKLFLTTAIFLGLAVDWGVGAYHSNKIFWCLQDHTSEIQLAVDALGGLDVVLADDQKKQQVMQMLDIGHRVTMAVLQKQKELVSVSSSSLLPSCPTSLSIAPCAACLLYHAQSGVCVHNCIMLKLVHAS
jgi:hypothetical protein